MKIQNIRNIAKVHKIETAQLGRNALIHAIQLAEGNFDCFGSTEEDFCDQSDCLWRDDCLTEK